MRKHQKKPPAGYLIHANVSTCYELDFHYNSNDLSEPIYLENYHHKRHILTFSRILREIKSYANSRTIYIENNHYKCHILLYFPIFREINSNDLSEPIYLENYHHKCRKRPILREIKSYAHSRTIYIENNYHKCHILPYFPIFRETNQPIFYGLRSIFYLFINFRLFFSLLHTLL